MESCGEMEIAKNFYETSKDYLSLARIYCYTEQVDKVNDSSDYSATLRHEDSSLYDC